MAGQSTQNGAADARPRSPARVAYLLWYWALAHLAAARVAIFTNLQPLATALLGQLFLGERVTAAFFGAAAVVIAGVLLAQWRATDAAEEALLESPAKP